DHRRLPHSPQHVDRRSRRLDPRSILRWRERGERERVQAGGEFVLQGLVDQPLARDPALAFEGGRHDLDTEVTLAAFAMAGMAAMARGFVLERQARRRNSRPELLANPL